MKALVCFFIGVFFFRPALFSQADGRIDGDIADSANHRLAGCSVFINHTSIGTQSDQNGKFTLQKIPAGTYELIFSSIGYKTYVMIISGERLPGTLHIRLKLKTEELATVIVTPFISGGWDQWGKIFVSNFIGTYGNASECRIKNPEVVRFKFYDKDNLLIAEADKPIVISNPALGYNIIYHLETFYCDLNKNTTIFNGYPQFEEMTSRRRTAVDTWKKNRMSAYKGSLMHLIRALYSDDLPGQGFELRRITETDVSGEETSSTTAIKEGVLLEARLLKEDSAHFYRNTKSQPVHVSKYDSCFLLPEDLVTSNGDGSKSFFTASKLFIRYRGAKEDFGYIRTILSMRKRTYPQSVIYLRTQTPVRLWANGSYYAPDEIFAKGYLAWLGKLSNALPLNYQPGEIK